MNESNSIAVADTGHHSRRHSSTLIKQTQEWIAGINLQLPLSPESIEDGWSPNLRAIAFEGSFLGYTRVVKLCRAVHATVQKVAASGDSLTLTRTQIDCLKSALHAIGGMVERADSTNPADLQVIIQSLQEAFNTSEHQYYSPLIGDLVTEPKVELVDANGVDATLEHRDLDVYQSAKLDSLDHCFEEESWIVSQLASLAEDLASGTHAGHPTGRLLHVLRGHKFFSQVDRVCLAGRVALANQLVVIDAALSDRCQENSLKKGYSCFVNPEGSLFKMRPGTVRVFGDSEQVLSSFAHQGKPAQRSIALIADQGLRSGLCLAIGRGTEIQGFLFLNSQQEGLFKTVTVNSAPLLSLFGLVATIALDTSGFHISASTNDPLDKTLPRASTVFNKSEFEGLITKSLAILQDDEEPSQVEVTCGDDSIEFLYLPTTVIGLVADLIFRLNLKRLSPDRRVSVVVQRDGAEMQIKLQHYRKQKNPNSWEWLSHTVRYLNTALNNKPLKVKTTESSVIVAFAFEPLLHGPNQLRYSVVY